MEAQLVHLSENEIRQIQSTSNAKFLEYKSTSEGPVKAVPLAEVSRLVERLWGLVCIKKKRMFNKERHEKTTLPEAITIRQYILDESPRRYTWRRFMRSHLTIFNTCVSYQSTPKKIDAIHYLIKLRKQQETNGMDRKEVESRISLYLKRNLGSSH